MEDLEVVVKKEVGLGVVDQGVEVDLEQVEVEVVDIEVEEGQELVEVKVQDLEVIGTLKEEDLMEVLDQMEVMDQEVAIKEEDQEKNLKIDHKETHQEISIKVQKTLKVLI